jgi:DNA polymerase elongation subunit (family B)
MISREHSRRQNPRCCDQGRTVVLDIETISLDDSDQKGALTATAGRIACICLLIADEHNIREVTLCQEDESQVLRDFWDELSPTDILVGHNILSFDIPFIRQRSWILGVRPSRDLDTRKYYTADVIDTLETWTNWGNKKGATLEALGTALGCGGKSADGTKVEGWWADQNFEAIKSYCRDDVRLTYRVYCRLTYQEPKPIVDSNPACGLPGEETTCCN